MQALAAGRLHEALEAELVEPLAQLERGERDAVPVDAAIGIEIEHHEVGALDLVGVTAPRVDLERAELREPDEARHVVDLHVLDDVAVLLLDLDGADRLGRAGKIFFWKKHGLWRPSGQRTSVSGRSATCGSIQSATTARYAISCAFVMPCSG